MTEKKRALDRFGWTKQQVRILPEPVPTNVDLGIAEAVVRQSKASDTVRDLALAYLRNVMND